MVKGLSPDPVAEKPGRTQAAIYAAQRQIRDKPGVNCDEQSVVTAIRLKMVPPGDLVQ